MGIVQDFAAAFNRNDADALVGLFTDRATYDDLFFGRHAGREGLRAMFARMFHEGRGYQWSMDAVVADERHAAAEWTFSYTVSDAIPRSAGRTVRFGGMSIFDLDGGKIAAYREYADTGVAMLQIGLSPEAVGKVLSRKLR
jgi:steroid delta-isomerase-like uncharacterized protein